MTFHLVALVFLLTVVSGHEDIITAKRSGSPHNEHDIHVQQKRGVASVPNSTDIIAIITMHNKYRRMEGAANINKLVFSNYLASMAQDWAAGCNFVHGMPPRIDKPWSWIGQNLYAVSVPKLNYTRAVLAWYSEKSSYNFTKTSCAAGRICGHYTQVVWWESDNVGCAGAICPALGDTSFTNAGFIVCNYGPGGNYVGEKPFTPGPACSLCAAGKTCDDRLCA